MPGSAALDDGSLFARARSGDGEALTFLVDRHKDALVNYLTRLSGCRDRAEDVAQETFVRLLERSARYVERGKLRPYLYRIATNLVRTEQRREQRWRLLQPRLAAGNGAGAEPRQLAALERRELGAILAAGLERVPLRYRVPLVLRDVEDWTYAEIADLLGCKAGTVKSRIHRGRESLRRLVAPYWNGEPS
ncbi:MAG: RNA polymerase sigma factor [Acidobacteriota bacterium]|nr:RNA polymerase sigma factor [Acidobacteriota bacterium]